MDTITATVQLVIAGHDSRARIELADVHALHPQTWTIGLTPHGWGLVNPAARATVVYGSFEIAVDEALNQLNAELEARIYAALDPPPDT